ncbi:MAG: hypothetical protein AAF705_04510, partial [Bacteroidota bacterium]
MGANLTAQCSNIYIYRVNNLLQPDKDVYLIQDGEVIARIGLGDRYKATVCSEGVFNFAVKMNPENVTISSKTVNVSSGNDYFLKVGASIGIEIATIAEVNPNKGLKTINKNSKFTSNLRTLQITENPQQSVIQSGQESITVEAFQPTQIVNNFKFEIVGIIRASSMAQLDFKITNLSEEDRTIKIGTPTSTFYDDVGSIANPSDICITN